MPDFPGSPFALSAEVRTRQRDEAMSQAVKGLFLINGGAALALVAFLKDVWSDDPALVAALLTPITWLVVGVAFAGTIHLLRYVASFYYQKGHWAAPVFQVFYFACTVASLAGFGVAMILLVSGLRSALH